MTDHDDDIEPDGSGVLPDPWDRLTETNETERAYAAFLAYRNLPPASRTAKRTVPLAYGADYTETHPKWKPKLEQIQHWMALHQWRHRALLWDEDQANMRVAWDRQAILDMRSQHAEIANELLERAITDIRASPAGKWEPKDLLRMLDLAFRNERLARGDSDHILTHVGPDGGPIQIDSTQSAEPDANHLIATAAALEEAGAMPEGTADAVARSLGRGADTAPAD